jgi:hypothetical protein
VTGDDAGVGFVVELVAGFEAGFEVEFVVGFEVELVVGFEVEFEVESRIPLVPPTPMLPPPERAARSDGSGVPLPKPMFIAVSIDFASVAPLYLLEHFRTAARVVASSRPVTWVTPQPSSRSCCCRPIVSTRVRPCANTGAAQQNAAAKALSNRYFMETSRGNCHARRCAHSPWPANHGPRRYLNAVWAMSMPIPSSATAPATSTAGFIAIERLYHG